VSARPRLSIVIPAYNESARLPDTLARLGHILPAADAEIVVVDDGSSDGTAAAARGADTGSIPLEVLELPANEGKGAAVRAGVAATRGDVVLYMDADLATDVTQLDEFLGQLEQADVVVGSRAVPGAVVMNSTLLRRVMGRTFNRFVRVLTRLDVHDSQCGFKAFRGDIGRIVLSLSTVNGFAFDPEVLMIANMLDQRIVEVPVRWTAVDGSSVRPVRDSVVTGGALLAVVVRLRRRRVQADAQAKGWTPARASTIS
jgi:glycosyltransferase involved in cell wall biosynthesis